MLYMITLIKVTLTCSSGGDDLSFASSSITLSGVRCHSDRVGSFRLQSANDGLLQNGKITRSGVKRNQRGPGDKKKQTHKTLFTQAPIPSHDKHTHTAPRKTKHDTNGLKRGVSSLFLWNGTKPLREHFNHTLSGEGTFLSQEKLLRPIVRHTLNPWTNKPTSEPEQHQCVSVPASAWISMRINPEESGIIAALSSAQAQAEEIIIKINVCFILEPYFLLFGWNHDVCFSLMQKHRHTMVALFSNWTVKNKQWVDVTLCYW